MITRLFGFTKSRILVIITVFFALAVASYIAMGGRAGIKHTLVKILVTRQLVPTVSSDSVPLNVERVIYVLGGAGESLKRRFQTAADLYRQGVASKVLIKSESMLMAYDSSIGRNRSHNEWAREQLIAFGVPAGDIEPVRAQDGMLGTYSEAKTLTELVSLRGYQEIILVSSDYHTSRVSYIFMRTMRNQRVRMYVYPAPDFHTGTGLVEEFVKYLCYRVFL